MNSEETVTTSFHINQSLEIFGKVRFVALRNGVFSILVAIAFVFALQNVVPLLLPVVFFGIVGGTIGATQFLVSGRYDWHNLEKFYTEFLKLWPRTRSANLTDLHGWKISSSHKNEVYDSLNAEIIGFKLKTDSPNFDLIFKGTFDSLLKMMPVGVSVSIIRNSRPGSTDMRKELQQKGTCASESFLFFRFPTLRFGVATARKNLMDSMSKLGDRLTPEQMAACVEFMYEPGRAESSKKDLPTHKSAVRIDPEVADLGVPGKIVAAMSLAALPKKIDRRFTELWNSFQKLPGSVCVRFEAIPSDNLIKNVITTLWKHKVQKNRETTGLVDRDFVAFAMYAGGLIHGSVKEVTEAIESFESEIMRMGGGFEPIFGRDTAFLRQALQAMTPGSLRTVPFRSIKVVNTREAFFYVPQPLPSVEIKNPDLDLRLSSNTRLCIKNNFATPTFICGGMEGGKSTLLSFIALNHIQRAQRGESVASFICEAGDTFVFLREGIADVVFSLDLKDEKFQPLQDHPLRMFFAWGDVGLEAAHAWICSLMGIEPEKLARESRVVYHSLSKAKSLEKYRLCEFLHTVRTELAMLDKSVLENPDHPFRTYCSRLEAYCQGEGNRYGDIFDPDETSTYDYLKSRHFYFVKAQGTKAYAELDKVFFGLVNAVGLVLETRFEPRSGNPAECLVIYDEIHFYRKYVTQKDLSDANRQGRKQGKFLYYATQTLSDGVIDGESDDKKYGLLETCKRFFFIDLGSNKELWVRALKLNNLDDPVMLELERVAEANLFARSMGEYSWGFVDEFKRVFRFYLDISNLTLWCCTTHPGGVALRREALKTGLDFFEVCERLAEKIWPIPRSSNLSEDFLRAQMWNVFDIKPYPNPQEKKNG